MARTWSSASNTSPLGSSSSSDANPPSNHELFISFRSENTGETFTSHLNAALKRLDIRTYIDNNLERGEEIPSTLVRAIEETQLSVIVFSKNYAASEWCLDELLKILECGRTKGQIIVPVFYDIDPSDVRNQRGSYAEAFGNYEGNLQHKMEVGKWRDGLVNAANFSGWDCNVNRMESEIVEEIAMDVMQKLNRVYVIDLDHQITKYDQLAGLQLQYYQSINYSTENFNNHERIVHRILELKMLRSVRLLRLTPDILSHMENSGIKIY